MENYLEHITAVYDRIHSYIKNTPVVTSSYLNEQTNNSLFLKCENLQYTNSFKVRGAFSKVTNLPDKNKILITASAGNHGLAVAFAAKKFNMRAIVVVPEFVPPFRINRIKALDADVIVYGNTMDELNTKVAEYTQDPQYIYIHGFDDDDIIAGQATVAHELLQTVPDLDAIIVPVGGGGLISGIAKYAKSFNRAIQIYGSQTIGADAMSQSLAAGHIVALNKITSIAISLGVSRVGNKTFPIVQEYVDKVVTVEDDDTIRDLKNLLEKDKLLIEPASATALSALVSNKLPQLTGKKIGIILSGGNFSLEQLKSYL